MTRVEDNTLKLLCEHDLFTDLPYIRAERVKLQASSLNNAHGWSLSRSSVVDWKYIVTMFIRSVVLIYH